LPEAAEREAGISPAYGLFGARLSRSFFLGMTGQTRIETRAESRGQPLEPPAGEAL
jgi:hypothetical protein